LKDKAALQLSEASKLTWNGVNLFQFAAMTFELAALMSGEAQ